MLAAQLPPLSTASIPVYSCRRRSGRKEGSRRAENREVGWTQQCEPVRWSPSSSSPSPSPSSPREVIHTPLSTFVQGLIDRAAIVVVCNEDNIRKSVYLFTLYMHIKVLQMLRFTRRNNCKDPVELEGWPYDSCLVLLMRPNSTFCLFVACQNLTACRLVAWSG